MSIKFLVFGGEGVFWVFGGGGGGSADFIFMGTRIFLIIYYPDRFAVTFPQTTSSDLSP